MFVFMNSQTSLKIGQVESKTWSQGQILEKPCVHSRGHILVQIFMKPGQIVCFDDFQDVFENESCRVKN